MNNTEIFKKLRGYYDSSGYHVQGGEPITINELLAQAGFKSTEEFSLWYTKFDVSEVISNLDCDCNKCTTIIKNLLGKKRSDSL